MPSEFSVLFLTNGGAPSSPAPGGGHPLSVVTEDSIPAVTERLRSEEFDCVIADVGATDTGDPSVLDAVRDEFGDVPFILLSDGSDSVPTDAFADSIVHTVEPDQQVPFRELATYVSATSDLEGAVDEGTTADRFGVFARHSRDAVVTADEDGHISDVNPAASTLFGYESEELVGEPLSLVFAESDATDAVLSPMTDEASTPSLQWQTVQLDVAHAEGHEVPVLATFGTFSDADGRYYTGIIRDISERKRLETELESHFERVTDAFFALDTDFDFRYVNDHAAELLGVHPETVVGDNVWDRFPGAVNSTFQEQYEKAMETQESVSFEEYFPPLETWFSVRAYPSETGLSVYFQDVTERKEREQELRQRRAELESVAQLNRVVHGINEALVEAASHEAVERLVCEELAESPQFDYVWLGRTRQPRRGIDPVAAAGDGPAPADIAVESDPSSGAETPAAVAAETQTLQVVDDIDAADAFDPCCGAVRDADFTSAAAIPLVYKDTLFGVLNIYAESPGAFTEGVVDALSQLRNVVGLAFSATERRAALIADQTIELELELVGDSAFFDAVADADARLELDGASAVDDHTFVEYFTVTSGDADLLREQATAADAIEDVSIVTEQGDETLLTLTIVDPPISTLLADHGGTLRTLEIDGETARLVAELPQSASIRSIVQSLDELFERADMRAKREHQRPERRVAELRSALENELTDRQREAIETALYAGYFEWPRRSDAEDIAEALGISSPTFHEHLRTAEQKLLTDLFDGDTEYVQDVQDVE
ncbi:bacterio-opsin activator domain-containing protein [Haloarchaeobius amylolyticus]|uniref:bacterio-opsin activator domain-containing protein n=1 Tax=Haloarchaeobius amylolyticus TaxID=1198296 RepID=UPI00226E813B|nr:bacterio-opsin activator domain-containing protein [Haloarchaeobius amylolyticus]